MKVRGQTVYTGAERIERLSVPEPNSGCWLWLGATRVNPAGQQYGRLTCGSRTTGTRRSVAAHRLAYETFRGAVPSGMNVCHSCDNPLCVNPAHLFVGTAKDNADDRDRKGRNRAGPVVRGEGHPSARLSDTEVAEILSSPESSRAIAPRFNVSDSHIRAVRRGLYRLPPPPNTGADK